MVESSEYSSEKDKDAKIERLIEWVRSNGGVCNLEARRETHSGVRGLYTSDEVIDPEQPLLSIPNKLIISPLHLQNRLVAPSFTYGELYGLSPELYDPKFSLKSNPSAPAKKENP